MVVGGIQKVWRKYIVIGLFYFFKVIILRNINIIDGTKTNKVERLSNVSLKVFFPLQLKKIC